MPDRFTTSVLLANIPAYRSVDIRQAGSDERLTPKQSEGMTDSHQRCIEGCIDVRDRDGGVKSHIASSPRKTDDQKTCSRGRRRVGPGFKFLGACEPSQAEHDYQQPDLSHPGVFHCEPGSARLPIRQSGGDSVQGTARRRCSVRVRFSSAEYLPRELRQHCHKLQ